MRPRVEPAKGIVTPAAGRPAGEGSAGRRAARLLAALLVAGLAVAGPVGCASGSGGSVQTADAGAGTPERSASARLVERGRSLLEAGSPDRAAAVLERAVRVDPSNGDAYLELARARIALGEDDVARGLLERAAALLRPYPDREARVDSLRARLGGGAPDG